MTLTHQSRIRHSSTLVAIVIVLMLWMSLAYITHQYQFDVSQHSDHQCQLFSCLQHGFSHSQTVLVDNPINDIFGFSSSYHLYRRTVLGYLARSPPVDLIK
ncbi:DUF2607 family protein [Vibrio pectenicida]|uniref:DUF2607 family protein n=1 Tax=Vibrio pectenicida TaxID=62763 RepID=A0A3R9FAT1_9VIBR|nr:DUF2607 family protein [Vibrio pectenicida]RSD32696.1 DUF2607 family protein [Vibrio pectenicida]